MRFKCVIFLLMPWYFILYAQTYSPENADTIHKARQRGNFYDTNTSSSRWIRELKNVIVVPPKNESISDTFNIQSPSNIYLRTEGRTISRIKIVRLKPFGQSINDTTSHNLTWLGKAGNAIHVSTREFIIRNALLFHEGDTINSFKLADSERYLRGLRYIDDARVVAIPQPDGQAEVLVIIQDILPYAVGFGTNFSSRANFSVTNRNIIGLGVELRAGAFIDSNKDNLMGYESLMRISNLWRSFISFEVNYLDKYENQRYGFTVNRDFYAPTTKYAGHLSLYNSRMPVRYYDPAGGFPVTSEINVRFDHMDLWLGRSFQIDKNPFNKQRNNVTVSLGVQQTRFIDRPENSQNLYYKFQNRTTYLSSLTYSQQAYYKTNLIYNFGRTEDIPYGYLLSVVTGKEMNELHNRPYIGAKASAGYFIPKFGYLSGEATYGTFFHNGTEQGTLDFELNYFTNLYVLGKFRQRTFINGQYTRQLDTTLDDYLDIDDDYGIPGFRNDSVLGRHRFNCSLEQDLFTPWNLYGFRFVIYAFANLSWLGGYDKPIVLNTLYSSFGIGVRIRNNRLIFNTLQIQFAYFPNIPENSQFRYIHFSKERVLEPRNFVPKAPEVVPLY